MPNCPRIKPNEEFVRAVVSKVQENGQVLRDSQDIVEAHGNKRTGTSVNQQIVRLYGDFGLTMPVPPSPKSENRRVEIITALRYQTHPKYATPHVWQSLCKLEIQNLLQAQVLTSVDAVPEKTSERRLTSLFNKTIANYLPIEGSESRDFIRVFPRLIARQDANRANIKKKVPLMQDDASLNDVSTRLLSNEVVLIEETRNRFIPITDQLFAVAFQEYFYGKRHGI